jgi:hypothetical protein
MPDQLTTREIVRRIAMISAPIGLIAFSPALFFERSAIDWLDQGASIALIIGTLAGAFAL